MSVESMHAPEHAEHAEHADRLDYVLWAAQAVLAAVFLIAGASHLAMSDAQLAHMGISPGLGTFIGVSELAGAIGLILPAAVFVLPVLTPLAAVGITTVMALATGFHVMRGEWSHLPLTIALGTVAAFVAAGRFWMRPFELRAD